MFRILWTYVLDIEIYFYAEMLAYKKYPEVKFYAIHRTDYSTEGMEGIEFPVDGDKIII